MGWNYQRDDTTFTPLAVGNYRIRIEKAEKAVASTGKDMLRLVFEVSGKKSKLFHNIVFLPDNPGITNRNLTQFFDAFPGIADGDFNTANWVGKVGACKVKHETYNGDIQARVDRFIPADKQGMLPPWVEPENGSNAMMGGGTNVPNVNVPGNVDEEVPF